MNDKLLLLILSAVLAGAGVWHYNIRRKKKNELRASFLLKLNHYAIKMEDINSLGDLAELRVQIRRSFSIEELAIDNHTDKYLILLAHTRLKALIISGMFNEASALMTEIRHYEGDMTLKSIGL